MAVNPISLTRISTNMQTISLLESLRANSLNLFTEQNHLASGNKFNAPSEDPVGAFRKLRGGPWTMVGWLGVTAGFVILSYYCVVAGWAVDYLWLAIKGTFGGKHIQEVPELFNSLLASDLSQLFWQAVFMGATVWIVLGGVSNGLERANKLMMPVLFVVGGAAGGSTDVFLGGPYWQSAAFMLFVGLFSVSFSMTLILWLGKRQKSQSRILAFAGPNSYGVYLIHPLILVPITVWMVAVPLDPLLKFVIVLPIVVVICFIVSGALRRIPGVKAIL